MRSPGVLERGNKEKQPAQLIVGALLSFAVEALQNEHIGAAHCLERAYLVLPILKFALLMRCQRELFRRPRQRWALRSWTRIRPQYLSS
jgi:hypothetical protein